jgi:hypothetical protein
MHGENRNVCRVSVGKPKERDLQEDLGIGLRIILKWVVKE